MNENENLFIPASMGYDQETVPKSKDWVERLNPDSKLLKFNTGRVLVPESQAVNESLKLTKTLITPESSKDSEAKSPISLPPLKKSSRSFTKLRGNAIDLSTPLSKREIRLRILYYMICKRKDHRTSDHEMHTAFLKRSENFKAQPYHYATSSKQILKAKTKPFPPCTHCGFNDHKHDCRNYPECEICGSYDHFTSGHNRVIHIRGGVLAESSQSSESSIVVKCNTCGSTVHSTTDHNEFDHFKRGEKIQRHIKEPIWYLDSGCSRSMTGVKSYLHKHVEQPSPKVVFGDNSSCITVGYGLINCGDIVFTKVAFVNCNTLKSEYAAEC
ncbi:hypothetical protein Tco_0567997 [Tanacetum coccineum]